MSSQDDIITQKYVLIYLFFLERVTNKTTKYISTTTK